MHVIECFIALIHEMCNKALYYLYFASYMAFKGNLYNEHITLCQQIMRSSFNVTFANI